MKLDLALARYSRTRLSGTVQGSFIASEAQIAAGIITNASIASNAAIAASKLALVMKTLLVNDNFSVVSGSFAGIGTSGGANAATTEANVQAIVPIAGTFKNLSVIDPLGGNTGTLTFRKNGANAGAPGNMTVTESTTAGSKVTDSTNTVTVAANDLVNYACTVAGVTGTVTVEFDPS
jgi:hypothetical protein